MAKNIRIVSVDDNERVREQVRALVKRQPRMQVIGEAGNGHDVMALVREHVPEIVLMDIEMPGMDGLRVLKRIKQDDCPTQVIMVSGRTDRLSVTEAQRLGASGYVAKQDLEDELIQAIQAVVNGECYVSRSLQQGCDKAASPLRDGGNMEVQKQKARVREPNLGKRVQAQLQAPQNRATQHEEKKARLLILDDEVFVHDYIHTKLKENTQLEIVPYSQEMLKKRDANTGLQMVAQVQPDVILLDLMWQEGKQSGWPMLKQLRESHPHIPVIVFSNSCERIDVNEAVEKGARGYVAKIDWMDDLIPIILKVLEGGTDYSRSVPRPENRPIEDLTKTETKVFKLYVRGLTRVRIAQELFTDKYGFVNRANVDTHVFNMKEKMGNPNGWKGVAEEAHGDPDLLCELNSRERRMFDLYVNGMTETNKIAEQLDVSETVVNECMETVRRKLNCLQEKWKSMAKKAHGDPDLLCELDARERRIFDLYVGGTTKANKMAEVLKVQEIIVKECMQSVRRKLKCHWEGWKGIARELRLID